MTDYPQTAATRWPARKISGDGRFAMVPLDDRTVVLFQTYGEARRTVAHANRVEIFDLDRKTPPAVQRKFIRDLGWERDP